MSDGVTPDGVLENTRNHLPTEAESVRRYLLESQGLWIDPHTAEYLVRRAVEKASPIQSIEVIAACARTGRCAFHALPASQVQAAAPKR